MSSNDFPRLNLRSLFDADYYRAINPDLANLSDSQAFSHFQNIGVYELRKFSPFFDLRYYLQNNTDVRDVYAPLLGLSTDPSLEFSGANLKLALDHFLDYGIFEGRPFSSLFDLNLYRVNSPDLAGFDNSQLFRHFLDFGFDEGRRFSPQVDLNFYRASNPDLAGLNNLELLNHFLTLGIAEGRQFFPLLDLGFYRASNPDLQRLSNTDLANHFFNFGLKEGRKFSPFFDVRYYLFNNPDLGVAGFNYQQAFDHFLRSGLDEGRRFSQFFDVNYYLANNPDLRAAGFGLRQAFYHFINSGLQEARRPSLLFDPVYYLTNNPDLAAQQLSFREAFEDFQLSGLGLGRRSSIFFDPVSMAALIRADFREATVNPTSVLKPDVKWDVPASGIITYSFVTTASALLYEGDETGIRELDPGTKNNIRNILQQYSQIIPVTFVEVPDRPPNIGQMRFMFSDGPGQVGAAAYGYYPFDPGDFIRRYPVESVGGDVHLNPTLNFSDGPGTEIYETLLHEIGHAVGLKHPSVYGAGDQPPVILPKNDNNTNTVMTYNSISGATGYEGAFARTLMLDDIRTLQFLYGASYSNNTDTTYQYNGSNFIGVKQTIWDSGGIDTLDFSNLPALPPEPPPPATNPPLAPVLKNGYYFDMNEGGHLTAQNALSRSGYFSFGTTFDPNAPPSALPFRTDTYGTNIAYGSLIENLIGSPGNDEVLGTNFANNILGFLGDDTITGARGADLLTGGPGFDTFVLARGDGGPTPAFADTITDFNPGEDKIGLAIGLRRDQIVLTPGVNPNDTFIRLVDSGEYLAIIGGLPPTAITDANFAFV